MEIFWHCKFCGDHGPAEAPYELGDKEPCTKCGQGTAHVMTLAEAARLEAEMEQGVLLPKKAYTE